MKSIPFAFMIVFCVAIWEFGSTNPVAFSCDSCGQECARACGTRHFRSCCFNYVRKRSTAMHPYSLNKLRYDILYHQFPYGNQQKKVHSKIDELNTKPREDLPAGHRNSLQNENDVADMKNYYAPWKEEANTPLNVAFAINEYDEHQKVPESELQSLGIFET